MYSWSVVTYYHEFLTDGSCFVLIITTGSSAAGKLDKPSFGTNYFGKTSIKMSVINSWNKTQTAVSDVTLKFNLQQSQRITKNM